MIEIKVKDWNIEELTGYKPLTSYYFDFSIAEAYGIEAMEETLDNAIKFWKDDYKVLTELVMVLNWKMFEHNKGSEQMLDFYYKNYIMLSNYCENNFTKKQLQYYYKTTD